jgi:hypothetical protein
MLSFAGVVEQIARHFLDVLSLPAKREIAGNIHVDADAASA